MFKCGGVRELPAANDVIMLKTKATATLYKSSKKRNILSSDPIRTSWKYKKKKVDLIITNLHLHPMCINVFLLVYLFSDLLLLFLLLPQATSLHGKPPNRYVN